MNTENLKKEIKKVRIGHIALLCAGVFLAFAIIGSILLAAGSNWAWGKGFHINFSNIPPIGPGELFEVNDRFDVDINGVNRIEIISISDDANISSGPKGEATLIGQCRSVGTPKKLEVRKQGSTLVIEVKYPQSTNNSTTRFNITIPEGYDGELSVSTVSGEIFAQGLPFTLGKVSLHSISGDVDFGSASYDDLTADTTSGEITINGVASRTHVKSVSGDVVLDYSAIAETSVSTVSGSVRAAIPDADPFIIDFGSTSGDFSSTHPGLGVNEADRGFNGSTRDGKITIKVNTTSGDFTLEGK